VSSHRVEVAIFGIAFAIFGLVAFALAWSCDWAYAALANANGVTGTTFTSKLLTPTSVEWSVDLDALLEWHRRWTAYVIGFSEPPAGLGTFSGAEYTHMADVRNVFRGAEVAAVLALAVAAFRLRRARRDGDALRLVRDGGVVAASGVAVVGIVAVFAFDQLFLLFHELFFPQGNFLFDPSTSNLLRLYPEWYWQGVTAGVAVSFIAAALLAAVGAHLALRRAPTKYTRAA
jgi:integral membrane protein (TIGR01906 family)